MNIEFTPNIGLYNSSHPQNKSRDDSFRFVSTNEPVLSRIDMPLYLSRKADVEKYRDTKDKFYDHVREQIAHMTDNMSHYRFVNMFINYYPEFTGNIWKHSIRINFSNGGIAPYGNMGAINYYNSFNEVTKIFCDNNKFNKNVVSAAGYRSYIHGTLINVLYGEFDVPNRFWNDSLRINHGDLQDAIVLSKVRRNSREMLTKNSSINYTEFIRWMNECGFKNISEVMENQMLPAFYLERPEFVVKRDTHHRVSFI